MTSLLHILGSTPVLLVVSGLCVVGVLNVIRIGLNRSRSRHSLQTRPWAVWVYDSQEWQRYTDLRWHDTWRNDIAVLSINGVLCIMLVALASVISQTLALYCVAVPLGGGIAVGTVPILMRMYQAQRSRGASQGVVHISPLGVLENGAYRPFRGRLVAMTIEERGGPCLRVQSQTQEEHDRVSHVYWIVIPPAYETAAYELIERFRREMGSL